jgi:hypothetical protein
LLSESTIILKKEKVMDLEPLFQKWENAYKEKGINKPFVKDGIVDEDNYKGIVWLLRETNKYEGNLANLIKDCIYNRKNHNIYWKSPQTHYKESLAVYALLNYNLSNNEIKKHKIDGLKYGAIVNIKKISGDNKSDYEEITKHLKIYKSFLQKEIELLNPKVVIVGGMRGKKRIKKILTELFKLEEKEKFIYKSRSHDILFLETYHPSYSLIKWDDWINFFKKVGKDYLK